MRTFILEGNMAVKPEKAPVHILLVDDDPLIRSLGAELLANLGFRVATAGDGPEALDRYDPLSPPDLVILDYHLPGLSGLEVMPRLRVIDPKARVLAASGFFSNQEMESLKDAGVAGFLHKPFRVEELRVRIEALLRGGPEI